MKQSHKLLIISISVLVTILSACAKEIEHNQLASTSDITSTQSVIVESELESSAEDEASTSAVIDEAKKDWEFDTPENQNVNSDMITAFYDLISDQAVTSVVIARNGYIISEYYRSEPLSDYYIDTVDNNPTFHENTDFSLFSCTKSVISALIGIAIDRGYIEGVETRIADYFPELAEEQGKENITIKHLLTHTAGFLWDESILYSSFLRSDNSVNYVLNRPLSDEPGDIFKYNTGATHLLSAILQKATNMNTDSFARSTLFYDLGITNFYWECDSQIISLGGTGLSLTSRDAAKFGQLYLNNGKWQGKQVISQEWIEKSVQPQVDDTNGPLGYGYLWWLFPESGMEWIEPDPGVPFYAATGYGGQSIFVVPELNLVTVVTGWFPEINIEDAFSDYIMKACE